MKKPSTTARPAFTLLVMLALACPLMKAVNDGEPPAAALVHMVVTEEAKKGQEPPPINANEVQVYQGHERVQVADWIPCRDDHAGLQVFILLDDESYTNIATQFEDLRRFMLAQPPTTLVGVGYMRDGTVDITQNLTMQHEAAAKALRLPLGNGGAFTSIFLSIMDLLKRWPASPMRREVLVVSDGIDRFGGNGPANPYVDETIEMAQKEGVIIYSIYANGVGPYARSFWLQNWGQNYLSKVSEETGGQFFFLGYETPVSFAPYLEDLARKLNHQFLLVFLPKPVKKSGLESVRVRTEIRGAQLMAATRVYVPASPEM